MDEPLLQAKAGGVATLKVTKRLLQTMAFGMPLVAVLQGIGNIPMYSHSQLVWKAVDEEAVEEWSKQATLSIGLSFHLVGLIVFALFGTLQSQVFRHLGSYNAALLNAIATALYTAVYLGQLTAFFALHHLPVDQKTPEIYATFVALWHLGWAWGDYPTYAALLVLQLVWVLLGYELRDRVPKWQTAVFAVISAVFLIGNIVSVLSTQARNPGGFVDVIGALCTVPVSFFVIPSFYWELAKKA